jgi:hypothetical protein
MNRILRSSSFLVTLLFAGPSWAGISVIDGEWNQPFKGSLAGQWLLFHDGDFVRLSGVGFFRVRLEVEHWFHRGELAPLCFQGVVGEIRHVGSGGGLRVDDPYPLTPERSMLGSKMTGYNRPTESGHLQWRNEFFYLNGSATLRLVEGQGYASINYGVSPTTQSAMNEDLSASRDPHKQRVRAGVYRDADLIVTSDGNLCVGQYDDD